MTGCRNSANYCSVVTAEVDQVQLFWLVLGCLLIKFVMIDVADLAHELDAKVLTGHVTCLTAN